MPPRKRARNTRNGSTTVTSPRQSSDDGVAIEAPRKRVTRGVKQSPETSEDPTGPRYFLMKAEPESRIEKGRDVKFSIDDLKAVTTEPWDGVRNAEASKTMRERMKLGDKAFFYHSNTKSPGIAGIVTISKEGYPDSSAWDKKHRRI